MSHYTHLTIEERESTRVMLEKGFSFRAIAKELDRSPSTISREVQRSSYANGKYIAHYAQKLHDKRKKHCGAKAKLEDKIIREYVTIRMNMRWTPEQISKRAELEHRQFSISYNTIYRAINSGVLPKELRKIMRFKSKNKKPQTGDKRGKVKDAVSIHERPAGAQNRTRFGHWESDTILGMRKTGCIGTHVERKSGFLVAFWLQNRRDDCFNIETIKAFEALPKRLKRSFTTDNGCEFYNHKELTKGTNMKVFFCDPYSPWQRGSNENTNGLIRQFYPKGTSFADITPQQLQHVVDLINNRPRKRLGFKTPCEVLQKLLRLT